MIRFVNLTAIIITLVASVALFRVKYEATDFAEQVTGLRSEIASERDQINVLKAEWNFLNEPRRIQRLADQYLELQNLDARQIVTIQELSERFGANDGLRVEQPNGDLTGSLPPAE